MRSGNDTVYIKLLDTDSFPIISYMQKLISTKGDTTILNSPQSEYFANIFVDDRAPLFITHFYLKDALAQNIIIEPSEDDYCDAIPAYTQYRPKEGLWSYYRTMDAPIISRIDTTSN